MRDLRALCLLFPLLVPVAPAQTPAAGGSEAALRAEEDARDLWRVFDLPDGRVLRARSRLRDGEWQVRKGRDWLPLGEEPASRQTVRSLMAEARRLEAELGPNELEGRVALAEWLARRALHAEAIETLDEVLKADPGHPGVARMLARTPVVPDLPAGALENEATRLKALVKLGAVGSPARREVAVARIEDYRERVDLRKLVAAELGTPQFRRRAFATLLAQRLFPGDFLKELSARAILDGFPGVREGAARALAAIEDVGVLAPAINALESANLNVRAHAAEALAIMNHPAAVEPIVSRLARTLQGSGGPPSGSRANFYLGEQIAIVMDYDVEIAQAASIADPIVSVQDSGVVFDVRAQAQITRTVELRTLVGSLKKLTGANPGRNPQDWLNWWDENKDQWRSRDRARAWGRGGERTVEER